MSDKKYIVKEPTPTKLGGWFCQVYDDQSNLVFETFQPIKKWAFQEAVLWLHKITDGKITKQDTKVEKSEPNV